LLRRRLNAQVPHESPDRTRNKPRPGTESGGQRRAATILRDLAGLPIGTPQDRLGLLSALRERHLIADDEAVPFWDGSALSEVQVVGTEVYRDPMPSDLPEDLKAMVHEAVLLHQEGRLDEAEAWINTILGRVPNHPIALGNLAAIRAAQGRGKESRDVLRRVIAAHPDYLIARCNLATFLIQDRALDEAGDLLAGLAQRPRLHIEEIFSLYGAMAMLNRARGEHVAADALMASLEAMTQDEDDERLLALAKRRAQRVTASGRLLGALRKILHFPG
jgi:tetratricopeptide (TPR) repeat protein